MVPVMIGGLLLGGRRFKLREYLQVAAIVGGTAVFNLAKRKAEGKASSLMGLASLVASLMCDGVTGGAQVRRRAAPPCKGCDAVIDLSRRGFIARQPFELEKGFGRNNLSSPMCLLPTLAW